MLAVAAAVVAVWAVLIGAAGLCRGALGLSPPASLIVLAICYLVLAGLALGVIGVGGRGWLGAAGMLVPLAVAAVLALRPQR